MKLRLKDKSHCAGECLAISTVLLEQLIKTWQSFLTRCLVMLWLKTRPTLSIVTTNRHSQIQDLSFFRNMLISLSRLSMKLISHLQWKISCCGSKVDCLQRLSNVSNFIITHFNGWRGINPFQFIQILSLEVSKLTFLFIVDTDSKRGDY